MPALDDAPLPQEIRNPAVEAHNARLGLVLCAIYVVMYGVFVGLCAFGRSILAVPVGPWNVALVYGVGLILLAMVLAGVYLARCKTNTPGAGA